MQEIKTLFSSGKAYPWSGQTDLFFRGYFIVGDVLYRDDQAVEYLRTQLSISPVQNLLLTLNGVFSFVWEKDGEIIFATDRLRALPLFYTVQNDVLWIGDDMAALEGVLSDRRILKEAEEAYFSSKLFVPGRLTLLEGVFQIQAGCYCVYNAETSEIKENPYFRMQHNELEQNENILVPKLHDAYDATAKNLVKVLDGRTAVVPLSGGADSRMVLSMLKRCGYKKVLCFTYGREENSEAKISRQVAESFGYPWHFVPYVANELDDLRTSQVLAEFYQFACANVSTPHMMDFLAIKKMKEQGILEEDSVFVPGHSGDLIAGSHITPEFLADRLKRTTFLDTIYNKFFPGPQTTALRKEIEDRFPEVADIEMETMAAQSEWFNIQERQGKFIVNSVRSYEFFGYEWLIPLWDNNLFEFWRHVPIHLRYRRKLYFSAVSQGNVPSTNDTKALDPLKAGVRRVPFLRTIVRRGRRLLSYWNSPLVLEHYAARGEYLKACLLENPTFSTNDLICRQMLKKIHQRLDSYEKK